MSDNNNVDERGFIKYEEFIDSYGVRVRVKESSNASWPHVWVFIEGGKSSDNNDGAAHLNVKQAVALQDALSKFIDDIPKRWESEEDE